MNPMTDQKFRRFITGVFILGGCASLAIGLFDRNNNIATEWDALWNPITSTCYIISGILILFFPKKTSAATVLAFTVTSIYQQGIHFFALNHPGPVTYYALASSSTFDPLAYIALFITIPHLATRIGALHCAALYSVHFFSILTTPETYLATDGFTAAQHLSMASLLSHPCYIIALRYILRLQDQVSSIQQRNFASKAATLGNLSIQIKGLAHSLFRAIDQLKPKIHDQKSRTAIRRIENSASQLQTCLRDADDLAKLDNPILKIESQLFDLNSLIREETSQHQEQAQKNGLTISHKETSEPIFVRSDANRLRQVVRNLISNAIKYTPQGEITLKCEHSPDQAYASFSVSDTGLGIPEASIQKIFEPYVRLDNHYEQHRTGSGLGLPIVKKIVTALGGSVRVSSQPGIGSTFTVTLKSGQWD